jgi:hypothetical protein
LILKVVLEYHVSLILQLWANLAHKVNCTSKSIQLSQSRPCYSLHLHSRSHSHGRWIPRTGRSVIIWIC